MIEAAYHLVGRADKPVKQHSPVLPRPGELVEFKDQIWTVLEVIHPVADLETLFVGPPRVYLKSIPSRD